MESLSVFSNVCETLCFSPLTIEAGTRRVIIGKQVLPLTKNEFDILLLLAQNPNSTFSLNKIYSEIWNMPALEDVRTVRVHVSRLRKKLREAFPDYDFIKLVWGQGYTFAPQTARSAKQTG